MKAMWHDATRTLLQAQHHVAERVAVVVLDPAVAAAPIAERVCGWLAYHGFTARTIVAGRAGDFADVLALNDQLAGASVLVAVGGGVVLDQAKLASVATGAAGYLTVPQRSGLVALPPQVCRHVALVAVPTTLGTGSESSLVACLTGPEGKRLVCGAALRPDSVVLDPLATETLPADLVQEAALEALVRVVSPYLGDHDDAPTQDGLAEVLARRLIQLGFEVRDARAAGAPVPAEVRAEIAQLSGYGHAPFLCRTGDPYAVKGWLIANELSYALGVRKMTAFAALLPHLWRRIRDHDGRLGSARRLRRLWSGLREAAVDPLPTDPAMGIEALIDAWGLSRRVALAPQLASSVARRITRAWGAGLPMLPLTTDEVHALLSEVGRTDATGGDWHAPVVVTGGLAPVGG